MRKTFFAAMVIIMSLLFSQAAFAADVTFDTSNISNGVVSVNYSGDLSKTIKVMIEKGSEKYTYTLKNTGVTNFPLQMGDGEYKISVLQNVEGTKYAPLASESFSVSGLSDTVVYQNSIQIVNFSPTMSAIQNALSLTAGASNSVEKANLVYEDVISNVSYDFDKFSTLSSDYIPVIDEVYNAKSGICYDYAALFAACLREMGIPTKVEMGYFTEVQEYHAWNSAYIDGRWMKIDTTYDAQAKAYGMEFSQEKNSADFKVAKQY